MEEEFLETYQEYLIASSEDSFDFEKFNQYAIIHHSSAVEGSTLSKEETYLLLDEGIRPNKPTEHSIMALDHLTALKDVISLANNKTPLTEQILKNLSSKVMENTGGKISAMAGDFDSSKGDYRKLTVRAGTRTFIDYKKVPGRVQDLLLYINENINKTSEIIEVNKLAYDVHFQLVSIHPFADGNGRLSRLLMNYVQQYHQKPLGVVYQNHKHDYFKALEDTRIHQDIDIFRSFMFKQQIIRLKERIHELTNKQQERKDIRRGFIFLF